MEPIPPITETSTNKELRYAVARLVEAFNSDLERKTPSPADYGLAEPLPAPHSNSYTPPEKDIPYGSVKPHPYSDKMELWWDGRGYQTRMKDITKQPIHNPEEL